MIGVKVIHTKMMTMEMDGHYMGNLINGPRHEAYWADLATELMIRATGDGSLFKAWKSVEYINPVHVGDFMEFHGWIEKKGNTSFEVHFESWKTITTTDDYKLARKWNHAAGPEPDLKGYEGRLLLDPPVLCAKGVGVLIVAKEDQKPAPDPRFRIEG